MPAVVRRFTKSVEEGRIRLFCIRNFLFSDDVHDGLIDRVTRRVAPIGSGVTWSVLREAQSTNCAN